MSVVAYDFFSGGLTAAQNLDLRISSSGHQWQKLSAGWLNSMTMGYGDSAANGVPKYVWSSVTALNYLAVPFALSIYRAEWRRAVITPVNLAGFLGAGFIAANGDGYFGGWSNTTSGGQTDAAIFRSNANGSMTQLAAWADIGPYSAPFARLSAFQYDGASKQMKFFWAGAERASVVNAAVVPVYPAVCMHILGVGNTSDRLLEIVFSES